MSNRSRPWSKPSRDTRGITLLLASTMTIIVLLVLGFVMVAMALSVTPSSAPEIAMLTCHKNNSGNYTFTVVALSSQEIVRDKLKVHVSPDNPNLEIGDITGTGDCLQLGDTFTISNMEEGATYTVSIESKKTRSTLATLTFLVT
jgi:hypothetical protein